MIKRRRLELGVRPICQHNFGNNILGVKRTKNNAGIIGQIEIMQYYIKPSFAKNTQYATKFFNSEVKRTWISSFLSEFKPSILFVF